mgnify:CR=1 FL=1
MKKYLIEIADVVYYDEETEIDSFAVNSLDEVETELLNRDLQYIYRYGKKSDLQKIINGETTIVSFPKKRNSDVSEFYSITCYSYQEKLEELERLFQFGKEKLNKLFEI